MAQTALKLKDLEGKWYVNQSNFKMWLKGDKSSPTFNYGIIGEGKDAKLSDKVQYRKNDKLKAIEGVDTPKNKENTEFVWRGKGLKSLLKSKWKILYFDNNDRWAIIFFEKTLLTPEGFDVISREKELDKAMAERISKKIGELGINGKLTTIPQKD